MAQSSIPWPPNEGEAAATTSTEPRFRRACLPRTGQLLVILAGAPISLAAAQPDGVRLEPIIVAGTNVSPQAAAQSLPSALTFATGRRLEQAGVVSVVELSRMVPNFSQSHSGIRSYADTYALRGLANTEFLSAPAVVYYVDDIPSGDVASYTTDLLAVDRIEIFRGPQGSRFGKNSEAGVINIIARQPTDEFKGEAKTSVASFNTQQYQASASGPLAKGTLRFSLAGQYAVSDGFIRNKFLGTHADQQEGINGRASLNWVPTENWSVDFTATADQFDDGLGLVPLNGNFRQTASDFDATYKQSLNSQAVRVRGEWNGLALTAVTGRREFRLDPFKFDPDFSPITGNTGVNYWVQSQWSEELRVRPISPSDKWDWHAGFFFSTTDSDASRVLDFALPPPILAGQDVVRQNQETETYALFGEVTRTFHDKFDLTLGLRLDYTGSEWNGSRASTFGSPPPLDEDLDLFHALPKLTLAYHVTEEVQFYGSTGLGFKPGGFSMFINDPALREYGTESAWANELGVKSSWWDGKLTANAAAFYYDVNDYQVEQFGPGLSVTVANAPHAHTLGTELELAARPAAGWEFSGFFGCSDARLDRYTNPFSGLTVHDTRPQGIAGFNGGIGAQYQHPKGFFGRIEYAVVGDTYYDAGNTTAFKQSTYGLLNARVGFERKHWAVFLFGGNLTDTKYFTKKTEALNAGAPGRPQYFGVTVVARF